MELQIQSKPMGKWDARFVKLSKYVSDWSKDPDAHVGAVIVVKRSGAISLGYNGFPIGVEDSAERLTDKETKLDLIVHAEQNAIISAGPKTEGATIYVWGKPVCAKCAGAIIQSGIERVVAISPDEDKESKWYKTGALALQMFEEAGVLVDFYTCS